MGTFLCAKFEMVEIYFDDSISSFFAAEIVSSQGLVNPNCEALKISLYFYCYKNIKDTVSDKKHI